jgi:hypothetical protein
MVPETNIPTRKSPHIGPGRLYYIPWCRRFTTLQPFVPLLSTTMKKPGQKREHLPEADFLQLLYSGLYVKSQGSGTI